MRKGSYYIALILFTIFFYGYHVREFGAGSMISVMSLASCISIYAFMVVFSKVGKRES